MAAPWRCVRRSSRWCWWRTTTWSRAQIIAGALAQIGFRARDRSRRAKGVAAQIREQHPDLILLDVSLPDASGIEICRHLQTESGMSQMPVIFISGHEELAIKVAGFDAGGVDYITKPLAVREVIARVRTHIRLKRGYESLAELQAQRIQKLAAAQEASMPRAGRDSGSPLPGVVHPDAEGGRRLLRRDSGGRAGHRLRGGRCQRPRSGRIVLDGRAEDTAVANTAMPSNSPREVLHLVNSALLRILPQGVFFTMIYARLNRACGQLQLVNAAHPPAILLRARWQRTVEIIWGEGDVVGAFHDAVFDCRDMTVAARRPAVSLLRWPDRYHRHPRGRSGRIAGRVG